MLAKTARREFSDAIAWLKKDPGNWAVAYFTRHVGSYFRTKEGKSILEDVVYYGSGRVYVAQDERRPYLIGELLISKNKTKNYGGMAADEMTYEVKIFQDGKLSYQPGPNSGRSAPPIEVQTKSINDVLLTATYDSPVFAGCSEVITVGIAFFDKTDAAFEGVRRPPA